jgi:hypothetical protein
MCSIGARGSANGLVPFQLFGLILEGAIRSSASRVLEIVPSRLVRSRIRHGDAGFRVNQH